MATITNPTLTGLSQPIWWTSMSDDGKYMYCGSGNFNATVDDSWKSSDYGQTWTVAKANIFAFAGAASGTGKYVIVSNGTSQLFYSTDYGATFTLCTGGPPTNSQYTNSTYYSTDGQYAFTVGGNGAVSSGVYQSTDYGATFSPAPTIPTTPPTYYSYGGAMSGSGQYRMVFPDTRYGANLFYVSSDYGVTYATSGTIPSASQFYIRAAMSYTGQYWALIQYQSGTIRISSNYGASFSNQALGFGNLLSLAVSKTGQYITVATSSNVYRSSNYGSTFSLLFAYTGNTHDKDLAISEGGNYLTLGTLAPSLYLYTGPAPPPSATNAGLLLDIL